MIHPVPGMAFVIEEKQQAVAKESALAKAGFSESEAHQRNVGVMGTIYAVNESDLCGGCGRKCKKVGFRPGQMVIYSKFIAEQIELKQDDGTPIKDLRSVPVNGILATIT